MNQTTKPCLGITMGDPGGIGPEICVKTLSESEIYQICRPLIVGDSEIIANAVRFCRLNLKLNSIHRIEEGRFEAGTIDVIDLANLPLSQLRQGQGTTEQGRACFEYIAKAIEMALAGEIAATVTGPINKAALNAAGYHYSGHTEIYAELTGAKNCAMMLVDGDFRVVHVSTHVSLREACDLVKKTRIKNVISLADEALKKLGFKNPRLGVAGLNPHCGEGGLFGSEDYKEIRPAIEEARTNGINAEGPIPADTVFSKMRGGMYDLVVVMYHDQGHIPVKLEGFRYDNRTGAWDQVAGVNVTLGLPIIRTSVDHGTAFDKAGKGQANPQSMIQAVKLAVLLSQP